MSKTVYNPSLTACSGNLRQTKGKKTLIVFTILQWWSGNRRHWLQQQNPISTLENYSHLLHYFGWTGHTMFTAVTEGIMKVTGFTISIITNTCFLNIQIFSGILHNILGLEESSEVQPILPKPLLWADPESGCSEPYPVEFEYWKMQILLATCSSISSLPCWKCFSLNTQYIWSFISK